MISSPRRRLVSGLLLCGAVLFAACAPPRPAAVSPAEIPDLEARLGQQPRNADLLLRYAAALFAAQRCDSARAVALGGMALKPHDAVGPLVVGQCLERADEHEAALALYRRYLRTYAEERGAAAVRAREMLALRAHSERQAQLALAREAELAALPADPLAVAVLPLAVAGDPQYAPLSRGLAQMLISDLALLERFRMVERLQVGVLLQELELAEMGRVDPATAARVGRLLQAGRLVQGAVLIPDEANVRLEASLVQSTGEVAGAEPHTGRLRDLLRLEKNLVVGIAAGLGYRLSEAELQLVLEQGTQNLAAFLAYSRGLEAEDAGDYAAAAQHFGQAARADPGFAEARQRFQAAVVAPAVQQAAPTQVTVVAEQKPEPPSPPPPPAATLAAQSAQNDVSQHQGEAATAPASGEEKEQQQATASKTSASDPSSTTANKGTPSDLTATIRIVFRLP